MKTIQKKSVLLAFFCVFALFFVTACGTGGDATTPAQPPAATPPATPSNGGNNNQAAGDTDWANFVLDVSAIPQNVLDTTVYLGVSVRGLDNPYIVTKIQGMYLFADFLESIGQSFVTQVLDSGGSNAVEIDNMRQFAALAGGNAVVYADPNEAAIAPALAEAVAESGGFIGTAWNKPDDVGPMQFTPYWVVHHSADNATAGYQTARALFESMGGSGYIFVLEGMLGNTAAIDRAIGLERALAAFPDITVAHRDTANWSTSEALTLVETWLTVTPQVGGIWNANDNMATGALQALNNVGRLGEVGVAGIDANIDIVEEIANGNAVATVAPNGFMQSSFTLAIAYAAWVGQLDVAALPESFRDFLTPATLVTTDNVDWFIETYIEASPQFDFTRIFNYRVDS